VGTLIVGYMLVSFLSIMVLMLMAQNAPYGYEDEHGFHYGVPPENKG
jgi:hypothetical protein